MYRINRNKSRERRENKAKLEDDERDKYVKAEVNERKKEKYINPTN